MQLRELLRIDVIACLRHELDAIALQWIMSYNTVAGNPILPTFKVHVDGGKRYAKIIMIHGRGRIVHLSLYPGIEYLRNAKQGSDVICPLGFDGKFGGHSHIGEKRSPCLIG